jgi:hypothetical protein
MDQKLVTQACLTVFAAVALMMFCSECWFGILLAYGLGAWGVILYSKFKKPTV